MKRPEALLPDEIHVRRIRELLWTNREFGRAAVLVGSGFSRNALPRAAGAPLFPLWKEMSRHLKNGLSTTKSKPLESNDPLWLSALYESSFGRAALDALIASIIPDLQYAPGPLHDLLLSLPWADVFTTNYDTLLERASENVAHRTYETVQNSADLVGRHRPRIVKLHGSLPSTRPFVATREDYRRYPRQNPGFVNTVQQSIMENAFCLIGFSGDDPNFLAWTGWVRDHLGDAAPPVYLCGALDLAPQMRTFLEREQRVIAVDLGVLFPASDFPPDVRHRYANEWFLRSLSVRSRPEATEWVMRSSNRQIPEVGGVPVLHHGRPLPNFPVRTEHDETLDLASLDEALQRACDSDPGWIVVPYDARRKLWNHVEDWVVRISDLQVGDEPTQLIRLGRLGWVFDRALKPLFDDMAEYARRLLRSFPNPQSVLAVPAAQRNAALDAWRRLTLMLLRDAREEMQTDQFEALLSHARQFEDIDADFANALRREQALWDLQWLRDASAFREVRQWDVATEPPIWAHYKAAILSELGATEDAELLALTALRRIRSHQRRDDESVCAISQEGAAMLLVRTLRKASFRDDGSIETGRWVAIERVKASPYEEHRHFENDLMTFRAPVKGTTRAKSFEPGRYREQFNFSTGRHVLVPYEYLRFRDEVGLPFSVGGVVFSGEAVVKAIELLLRANPLRAVMALARVATKEQFEVVLNRVVVAGLPPESRDAVADALLTALADEHMSASVGLVQELRTARILEALSRIVIAVNPSRRLASARRVASLAANPNYATRRSADSYRAFFMRALPALDAAEVGQVLPNLLQIGIRADEEAWFDPLAFVDLGRVAPPLDDASRFEVARLLDYADGGPSTFRTRAIVRLSYLSWMGVLDRAAEARLGRAIWGRRTPSGLPDGSGLTPIGWKRAPAPTDVDVQGLAVKWILESELARVEWPELDSDAHFWPPTVAGFVAAEEYLRTVFGLARSIANPEGIGLGPRVAEAVLKKVSVWTESLPTEERLNKSSSRVQDVVDLAGRVIGVVAPALEADSETPSLIQNLLVRLPPTSRVFLYPVSVVLGVEAPESAVRAVHDGLISPMRRFAVNAVDAMLFWSDIAKCPSVLIDELVFRIAGRRRPALKQSLAACSRLVREQRITVDGVLRNVLDRALRGLLLETDPTAPGDDFEVEVPIPVLERPDIRMEAARLAAALHSAVPSDATALWAQTVATDPYPEVRNLRELFVTKQ